MTSPTDSAHARSFSWTALIHYAVIAIFVIGAVAYWMLKSRTLNPMADPMAAEAMALVQTHRSRQAPTIGQAIGDRVRTLQAKGRGVRVDEWTVRREQGDAYLVGVRLREEVTKGWFERDYLWRVDVARRSVVPLTLPAAEVTADDTDAAKVVHSADCYGSGSEMRIVVPSTSTG
jgi:hypothetical protein